MTIGSETKNDFMQLTLYEPLHISLLIYATQYKSANTNHSKNETSLKGKYHE